MASRFYYEKYMGYSGVIHITRHKAWHANPRLTSLQGVYPYGLHTTLTAISLWLYSQILPSCLFANRQAKTTVKGMLN